MLWFGPLCRQTTRIGSARREARREWPFRIYRSGEVPEQDFLHELSVEERLQAANDLTELCWRVAGKEIQDLQRRRWPFKITRGDQRAR